MNLGKKTFYPIGHDSHANVSGLEEGSCTMKWREMVVGPGNHTPPPLIDIPIIIMVRQEIWSEGYENIKFSHK